MKRGSSLRTTRWLARAPRIAVIVTCAALSAAGLRSALRPPIAPGHTTIVASDRDAEVESLAEAFARAYLTWNDKGGRPPEDPALAGGTAQDIVVPSGVGQKVRWTSVADVERVGDARVVTVATDTTRGLYHLAVPVERGGRGLLSISRPPAIVGAIPTGRPTTAHREPDVEDRELTAVVRRALANYLARDRADLLADLDGSAVVVLPDQPLRLRDVDAVTWVTPGRRVGALLRARMQDGVEMTLRYELAVTRRAGRWLVSAIHTNPSTEVHP